MEDILYINTNLSAITAADKYLVSKLSHDTFSGSTIQHKSTVATLYILCPVRGYFYPNKWGGG